MDTPFLALLRSEPLCRAHSNVRSRSPLLRVPRIDVGAVPAQAEKSAEGVLNRLHPARQASGQLALQNDRLYERCGGWLEGGLFVGRRDTSPYLSIRTVVGCQRKRVWACRKPSRTVHGSEQGVEPFGAGVVQGLPGIGLVCFAPRWGVRALSKHSFRKTLNRTRRPAQAWLFVVE